MFIKSSFIIHTSSKLMLLEYPAEMKNGCQVTSVKRCCIITVQLHLLAELGEHKSVLNICERKEQNCNKSVKLSTLCMIMIWYLIMRVCVCIFLRLRIAFKWIVRAFSGYLSTDQLLLLWDRILGYGSLEIVAGRSIYPNVLPFASYCEHE